MFEHFVVRSIGLTLNITTRIRKLTSRSNPGTVDTLACKNKITVRSLIKSSGLLEVRDTVAMHCIRNMNGVSVQKRVDALGRMVDAIGTICERPIFSESQGLLHLLHLFIKSGRARRRFDPRRLQTTMTRVIRAVLRSSSDARVTLLQILPVSLRARKDEEKEDDNTQDEETERNTKNDGAGVAVGQALLMKLFPELRAPLQEAMSDARETMKSISSPWWTVCNDASITNEQWQAAVAVAGLNIKERNKREDTTVALRFIQWLNNEPQRALRQTLESTLDERLAEIEKLGARASQRRAARHMRFLKQIKDAERKDQETSDEAVTSLLDSCQEFVDKCVDRETNRRRESAEQLTSRLKLGQDTWDSIVSEKKEEGDMENDDQDGAMKWSSTCESHTRSRYEKK